MASTRSCSNSTQQDGLLHLRSCLPDAPKWLDTMSQDRLYRIGVCSEGLAAFTRIIVSEKIVPDGDSSCPESVIGGQGRGQGEID